MSNLVYNFQKYTREDLDSALVYFQSHGVLPTQEQLDVLGFFANQFMERERKEKPEDEWGQTSVQMFMWGFILGTMTEHVKREQMDAEEFNKDLLHEL
jgi:hypothetical protein